MERKDKCYDRLTPRQLNGPNSQRREICYRARYQSICLLTQFVFSVRPYSNRQFRFLNKISNSMMALKLTPQEVSSLFERKLSERSGLVKDVRSAEFILREYETATVTKTAKEPLSRKRKITIDLACGIKN